MFFLKISGVIPVNKQTEFEQTYRYVSSLIPHSCVKYSLTRDFQQQDAYQFMSYWDSKDFMESFALSSAYRILKGAFLTLGRLIEDRSGMIMDITRS